MVLKDHGLSLEDWAEKHPADRRFLRFGRREHVKRQDEESPD